MNGRDEEFQRIMRENEMAGAIPLNEVPLSKRTQRQIALQGCGINIQLITETDKAERDVVRGYQILISDPNENTMYSFLFGEAVRNVMAAFVSMPHIGDIIEEDEISGDPS